MPEKDFMLEAVGEFPFKFYIEKAVPSMEKDEFVLEGIASTVNVDHDGERMSGDALLAMERAINDGGGVPLRVEHSKAENAIIGHVHKAWVDDRNQLHIRTTLDKSHPVSPILYNSMKQGAKMGFSVGGIVKRAAKEFVESVGKVVKTFYDVALKEVSVTPRPANYDAYAVAKSMAKTEQETDELRDSPWYKDFLNENPQLDYLHVFAKSIPDDAWRKVESSNINKKENMETKKATTGTDDDETKKGYVGKEEFNALKTAVTNGFESITGLFKALDSDAKDQHNPDSKKPEFEGNNRAKAMSSDAKDQHNPDMKKPEQITPNAAKAVTDTETDTKTKAETTAGVDVAATDSTKAATGTTDETQTDKYALETVNRSIKDIQALTKRIQGVKKATTGTDDDDTKKATTGTDDDDTKKATTDDETKTKAAATSTDEDTKTKAATGTDNESDTTKGIHPLDMLAATVAKALEAMAEKMEKTGTRYIGFEKNIVDGLLADEKFQEEVQKMMKMPGRKQSVSMGVPYAVTKEGRRFALVAREEGVSIEKSENPNKGKTFAEVFKKEYSSVRATAE